MHDIMSTGISIILLTVYIHHYVSCCIVCQWLLSSVSVCIEWKPYISVITHL